MHDRVSRDARRGEKHTTANAQDKRQCETSVSHGTLKRKRHEGCEEDREEARKEGPGCEEEGRREEEEVTIP